MSLLDGALVAVAGFAVLIAVYSWVHAARWSHRCQDTRIAVARKGRVRRNHSLAEWIGYAHQFGMDRSAGSVVYDVAGTRIAVFMTDRPPSRLKRWAAGKRLDRRQRKQAKAEPTARVPA